MKKQDIELPDFKIRPGLTVEELEEFKQYLHATGRKAGPFIKALIAREIAIWKRGGER